MNRLWSGILLFFFPFVSYPQSDSIQFNLKIFTDTLTQNISQPYCEDSVLAAPNIIIEGDDFTDDNEGIRISIANYKRYEDILVYSGLKDYNIVWNEVYGYLEIIGKGTTAEFTEAVRSVYYKNLNSVPNLEARQISVTLKDADYLPATQHFYKFINKVDITWTEARDSAAKMSYNGLKGYLATVTSAAENDFIWTKIDGVGWIGASDSEVEGDWKWMTGPEAGTLFWRGNYPNGRPINGEFSFWSFDEPNNAHTMENGGVGEDFAHINQIPSKESKSWNDLRVNGDGPSSQYYRPQGFVVEFGGMTGDPELQLSASHTIHLVKIAFSINRDFEICEGESIHLNNIVLPTTPDQLSYSYYWTPNKEINNSTIHNPIVQPRETIVYTAVGELSTCKSQAEFNVIVNPAPVSELVSENIICEGSTTILNPGVHTTYLWETGESTQTIKVTDEGKYTVTLTNEKGCTSTDSVSVKYSIRPQLDYKEIDTLVCGSKEQKLNVAFESGYAATLLQAFQNNVQVLNESTLSPTVKVDEYGIYSFKMEITDTIGCMFTDTFIIGFHNQPTALFQIDEAECEGYNLKLNYAGITVEEALFNWYSNGNLFNSGMNLNEMEIPLGYGMFNRTVGLKINEKGCVDSLTLPVTVTPLLDFWAENTEGCNPLQVQFDYSATELIDKFEWVFGDGDSSTEERPSHLYQNMGINDKTFDISLKIVSKEGCENTGNVADYVTVHPIPTIDFDILESDCLDEIAEVNYSGSGNKNDNYLWDISEFKPGEIIKNPGFSQGPLQFKRSSEPTVNIGLQVVSEFGCVSDSINKLFKRKPVFETKMDKSEGCPPLEIGFSTHTSDSVDNVEYTWNFGDGNFENGMVVSNTFYYSDSVFEARLIGRSQLTGCSDTLFLPDKIVTFQSPKAKFAANPNSVLINYPVIQFENQSTESSIYYWDFDDNSFISQDENPEHRFSEMGFYNVKLTATNEFGCIDSTVQQVSVAFDKVYPPNAFSPNAALEEDREFRIYAEGIAADGYRLLVFNRWGEIIFESKSQNTGWDGRMKNGNFAPTGVYIWILQYVDFRNENNKQQGTVTLLY
jgi:gliding motility-associated-like protein